MEHNNRRPRTLTNAFERALKVISKMRAEKLSLKKATLESGINPETVKRWARTALEKRNGRFGREKSLR